MKKLKLVFLSTGGRKKSGIVANKFIKTDLLQWKKSLVGLDFAFKNSKV